MGTFIEIIPPEWLIADEQDKVIYLLRRLDLPARRKKQCYIEWCRVTGVAITDEDIIRLLGVATAEMVRGA